MICLVAAHVLQQSSCRLLLVLLSRSPALPRCAGGPMMFFGLSRGPRDVSMMLPGSRHVLHFQLGSVFPRHTFF